MTVFVGCPEGCRYHTASAVYDLVWYISHPPAQSVYSLISFPFWPRRCSPYWNPSTITLLSTCILNPRRPMHHRASTNFPIGYNHLRSVESGMLAIPECSIETFGPRAFAVSSPSSWNNLPLELFWSNGLLARFKKELKTALFTRMLARQKWSSSHSIILFYFSCTLLCFLLWLTLLLPTYHSRQWKSRRIYASLVAKGLIVYLFSLVCLPPCSGTFLEETLIFVIIIISVF